MMQFQWFAAGCKYSPHPFWSRFSTGALLLLSAPAAWAQASGADLEVKWSQFVYEPMNNNAAIVDVYKANALALGRKFLEIPVDSTGSSDMGNVSWTVPSIHPTFAIGAMALNHTPGFTQISATDAAHEAMLQVAQALAMTGVDLVLDADLLSRAQAEFRGVPRP